MNVFEHLESDFSQGITVESTCRHLFGSIIDIPAIVFVIFLFCMTQKRASNFADLSSKIQLPNYRVSKKKLIAFLFKLVA